MNLVDKLFGFIFPKESDVYCQACSTKLDNGGYVTNTGRIYCRAEGGGARKECFRTEDDSWDGKDPLILRAIYRNHEETQRDIRKRRLTQFRQKTA